jgi:hypothetical protein
VENWRGESARLENNNRRPLNPNNQRPLRTYLSLAVNDEECEPDQVGVFFLLPTICVAERVRWDFPVNYVINFLFFAAVPIRGNSTERWCHLHKSY